MEVGEFLIAVVICFLIMQFMQLLWARRKFPSGPLPFPLFGSLWRIGWKIRQDTFMKLANIYGDIFTIWVGHIPVVVLTGFKAVQSGLIENSAAMSGRPVIPFFKILGNKKGVMFSNGMTWKQQRHFGKATLLKLGEIKNGLEYHIETEARQLVKTFAQENGQPLDPLLLIMQSAAKVIAAAAFGHPDLTERDDFQKLVEHINVITRFRGTFGETMYNALPSLMKQIPGPHQKALSSCEFIHSFVKKEVENLKNSQASQEPQSYMDFYLAHMNKEKNDSMSTFDEDNLVQVIVDLFIAGTDTIAATLSWGLFFMVAHPDIQEKVQKEIESALDPNKTICYEDRRKLPYSEAVVHEIQRLSSLHFFSLFRLCTTDLSIHDYYIPKTSLIIPDLCSVLLDPSQWETPQQFNPNHFLNKDGDFVEKEAFLNFGAGSRECLGKSLAQMELFIFFISLMKAFTFQQPEGGKAMNPEPGIEAVMQHHLFKICSISR